MPAAFDNCVKRGGRVRTKELGGGHYMHVCFIDGQSFAGEVKTKQAKAAGGTVDGGKASKADADYGPGMKASHCGICQHFQPPRSCSKVEGAVEASMWCKFFQRAGGKPTTPLAKVRAR